MSYAVAQLVKYNPIKWSGKLDIDRGSPDLLDKNHRGGKSYAGPIEPVNTDRIHGQRCLTYLHLGAGNVLLN